MKSCMIWKTSVLLLAITMLTGMAGCGGGQIPETPQSSSAVAETSSQTAEALLEESDSAKEEPQGIGNVYFLPYHQQSLLGTNTLGIYAEREGLVPGKGILSLHKADGTVVEQIFFSDAAKVEMDVLSQQEAEFVGWKGQGSKAILMLEKPLQKMGNYYISMTEDCLESLDGKIQSRPIDKGVWEFSIAPFGILGGSLYENNVSVGETKTISVVLAAEAVKCAISNYDANQVELLTGTLTEAGDLELKFNQQGLCKLDVEFLNAMGESVGKINVATYIADS